MCLSPIVLKERTVPCGKCVECLNRRQRDWTVRLNVEFSNSSSCCFFTLTYRDTDVPIDDGYKVLCKRDIQLFIKRLRRAIEPHRIRFFVCGEYGPSTLRPHYHGIIFNYPKDIDFSALLHSCWHHGFTSVSPVTPSRISYVAKYCTGVDYLPIYLRTKSRRPFILCSRRPAIGSQYLNVSVISYHRETLSTVIRHRDGRLSALPRYYRDRIFDDQMKFDISERTSQYLHDKYMKDMSILYSRGYGYDLRQDRIDESIRIRDKYSKHRKL